MKVFLVFLFCSFFAWTLSKLSEEYESQTKFKVGYSNVPDSLLFKKENIGSIKARIKASGFQFLSYGLNTKTITLNLDEVLEQDGKYFLTESSVKNQMEAQLPNSVSLVDLEQPIYYTNLYLVATKWVPVKPRLDLRLAQNHLLKGQLVIEPDSIRIKGPKQLISEIKSIPTIPFELSDVSADFSETINIQKLDSVGDMVISPDVVKVSGTIVRFSEKEFDVGIIARNVPQGYRLKMFPDHIKLYCKAGVSRLKELQPADFEIYVDFNLIEDEKYLTPILRQEPDDVFSVRLLQNRIEFVLERI